MAPEKKPPMAGFQLSSFSRRFAAAAFPNPKAPPDAAMVLVSAIENRRDGLHNSTPNVAIIPPPRVNTPQAPMFSFVREVRIAETARPAVPMTNVDSIARPMASFGLYVASSSEAMVR